MNGYLKQSTASQARLIGPFIDSTDFKTEKTALTIANTDIKLRANGTTLSNKNSGGGTHQVNGMYSVTWDATDTANVGELTFSVVVSGALQVFGSYVVLEEAIYDALFAASAAGFDANQRVNVGTWLGTAVNALVSGDVPANTKQIAGAAVSTSTAQLGVNVVNFGGSAGTFASGRPEVNTTHLAGAAVSTSSAQLGVNLVNIAGAAVNTSSAQIGANVVSYASGQAPLQPTVAGRTLDVSAGGEAGVDWANVGTPGSTVSLSATTVATATNLTNAATAGDLTATMKASVNAEVLDVLATDTFAEPSSVPAATSTLKDKLTWLFALARNKVTQTATTQLLRNDGDSATIGTSTVSDDGTTATRGKFT